MYCANMPHYDESFINDDNQNQRRNKRSYHVYKTNVTPLGFFEPNGMIQALDERGTAIIKKNIRNMKHRSNRYKPETTASHYVPILRSKTPDRLVSFYPKISAFDPKRLYDIGNNNIPCLTACKSFDNLTLKQGKRTAAKDKIRNGKSLQDLVREESIKHYVSPAEDYLVSRKGDLKNSYSVIEARLKPVQRRSSRSAAAPGVGVYRKICGDHDTERHAREGEACGEAGSGHRGSLRGANKLARRARSFKDDLLERISNMRSPAQPPHPPHLSSAIRSHSPLSPKPRSAGAKAGPPEETEITPAKELERLVKEVTFGLKHFSDVIAKRKLEMLPDNGTIVFESIANIHKAIRPYCGRSPQLTAAASRLCSALAALIRLCDDVTAGEAAREAPEEREGREEPDASAERVDAVVRGVTAAVAEAQALAAQLMARPALKPRPPVVAQRNSLPDIPLTPRELCLLAGAPGADAAGVRASHSSESVLDAPDAPPPKPARPAARPPAPPAAARPPAPPAAARPPAPPAAARPTGPPAAAPPCSRPAEAAPPLPPKRKSANDDCLLGLSADRLSLQSHSSGSLDSMLNVSNDGHDSVHLDAFLPPPSSDLIGICSCNDLNEMRSSVESHESHSNSIHGHSNHNRFSNESGFVSVDHAEISTEHSFVSTFSSHHYSSHTDSTFESTEYVTAVECSLQSVEGVVGSFARSGDDGPREAPPRLPAKTRRALRPDVQHYFPNVEIRQSGPYSPHEARPHTLAEHDHQRPPPLPLKKKHMFQSVAYSVMAYMEMFGNCSHALPAALPEAPPDMFRHSIHTYNLSSTQQSSSGTISLGHHQISRTMASSLTVQHLSTPPLSGSDDSVSLITSSRGSPVPPEPPALPPSVQPALPLALPLALPPLLPPALPPVPPAVLPPALPPVPPAVLPPALPPVPPAVLPLALPPALQPDPPLDLQPALPPAAPPALPPKMNKNKQIMTSSNELLPPSPRPSSRDSSLADDFILNNASSEETYVSLSSPRKFPAEAEDVDPADIILLSDVGAWLSLKGPDVRGGHPDALVVLATKATRDFAYQEAFLATYRTWVTPRELVRKLVRRSRHHHQRPHELRSTLSLLTRVVADLTMGDLERTLMREIMEFIYWLVEAEELPISKALRQILVDKQKQLHLQLANGRYEYESPCYGSMSLRRDTLLDFKASDLAEQMTLLDSASFVRITTAEVLSWPRDQSEESSPNLTRFTEHFNKMSYWARSRILEQYEAREREKYAARLLKVMKALRKLNNFNSYLALVSALDCPPVRRLGWPRAVADALRDHCALIDSSHSFRAYRQALADTQPPCIPYIGLVLQDLTFVHEGNPDLLPDAGVNFTKRLQQYNIMENMKRFHKEQYRFKKNERIQAMFNEFDDVLSEETMWLISETIKPRGGRSRNASAPSPPAPPPPPAT